MPCLALFRSSSPCLCLLQLPLNILSPYSFLGHNVTVSVRPVRIGFVRCLVGHVFNCLYTGSNALFVVATAHHWQPVSSWSGFAGHRCTNEVLCSRMVLWQRSTKNAHTRYSDVQPTLRTKETPLSRLVNLTPSVVWSHGDSVNTFPQIEYRWVGPWLLVCRAMPAPIGVDGWYNRVEPLQDLLRNLFCPGWIQCTQL